MSRREDKSRTPDPTPNNPFGSLAHLRESLPAGTATPKAAPKSVEGPARAVVRMERKGRGGKEVTVVSHLGLTKARLDEWLKALKNGLGCGGQVDGEEIVLQGDQRDRLPALLEARGVRKVTVG